jgi:nucleotide-binding universal stress UspA family protein
MRPIRKVLIPTDLSELSLAAMEYAASISETYGAEIYVLYVIEGDPHLAFPLVDRYSETALKDEIEEARKKLHAFVYWKMVELSDVTEVVRRGKASVEIPRFAHDEGIDLIIMATHGRTGLAHVLMGSVAEKVVRTSPVPVVTVKPKQLRSSLLTEEDLKEELHLS